MTRALLPEAVDGEIAFVEITWGEAEAASALKERYDSFLQIEEKEPS